MASSMWNEEFCGADGNSNPKGLTAEQWSAAGCGQTQYRAENAALGIINVALGVIGFVAVVFIIVGAVQYVTSSGEPGKITKAKNTIMYAVIGLVVALLAYAIVNFVLGDILGEK